MKDTEHTTYGSNEELNFITKDNKLPWRQRRSVGRNRKVAKSWFVSRCSSASLCPWERHLMLFLILEEAFYRYGGLA